MTIKNVKKSIARVLIAAVGFTAAAPAGAVWAAPAVLQNGLLQENQKGINLIFQGEGIGTQYNKSMPYDPDKLEIPIGKSVLSGGKALPFYDASGNFNRDLGLKTPDQIAGTDDKQAIYLFKQDVDAVANGEQPGYLYGYKIRHWMENDHSTPRKTYGMTQVPSSIVNFTATIEKDPTITINKVLRIGNGLFDDSATVEVEAFAGHTAATNEGIRKLLTPEAIKRNYTSGSISSYEDYIYPLDGSISKEYPVGEKMDHKAAEIPGFTLKLEEAVYTKFWGKTNFTTGYGLELTDPIGAEASKIPGSVEYNSDTKQASITTGNTHAQLKYRYRWNPNYDVQLTTQNIVYKDLDKDGVADNLNQPIAGTIRTEQSSVKFAAQTTVKPNEAYQKVAPKTSVSRYVLDKKNPYTIAFSNTGEGFVGNGWIGANVNGVSLVMDQDRNVRAVQTPDIYKDYKGDPLMDSAKQNELKSAVPYFTEGVSDGALNHELSFYMPNSNLKVMYNWVKNPAYISAMRVYYKHNNVNLTKDVVDLLNTGSQRVAKLDDGNYNTAAIREFRDAASGEADGIEYVIQFDSNGDLDTAKHPGGKMKIYAPKLERYLAPNLEQTSAANNPLTEGYTADARSWGTAGIDAQTYEIELAADPGKAFFDVNYAPDSNAQFEYLYEVGEGGGIKGPNGVDYVRSASNLFDTDYNRAVNPHVLFKSNRVNPNAGETYSVILEKDAGGKILSFYDAVPDLGYEFKEWLWDKNAQNQPSYEAIPDITGTLEVSGIQSGDPANVGHAVIRVKPVFQKVESMWGNYRFIADDTKLSYTGDETLQILLETDNNTASNDITWGDIAARMDFANTLQYKSGVSGTIRWVDLTDHSMMADAQIMQGNHAVRTFKAVVEPNASVTPYKVEATGKMGSDGTTSIVVDETSHPVTGAFRYIVTDEDGNILANVSGAQIMANGGAIPASIVSGGLTPGYRYKVYSAPAAAATPTDIPNVGGNVSGAATGILSDPSDDIIIPTNGITATLGLDPNPAHPDKLRITVSPTTEGTSYRLIGPDGSTVNTLTPSPAGSPVVFDNITQGGIYKVVPISTSNPNASSGNGTPIEIDTDTASVEVLYKLIISTGTEPSLVQVNGQNQTIPTPVDGKYIFEGIAKDSGVTIVFERLGLVDPYYPLASVNFSRTVAGHVVTGGISTQSFQMPQGDLIVTANYMPNGAKVASGSNAVKLDTFDGDSDADASGFPGFAGEPLYSDPSSPYIYRLRVLKTAANASHVAMVQGTDSDRTFRGLFSVKAQVEYKRESDTNWSVYDKEVNPITMTLATDIISADMTRVYGFYEVDTSAAAVPGVEDEDFHKPSYTNAFTVNGIRNNTDYVFGYFDTNRYPITVKSNRTDVVLTTHAANGTSYQDMLLSFADYQRQLAFEMNLPDEDANGVTWTFAGLSKSGSVMDAADMNGIIIGSDVLYIYFENDREQRTDREVELGRLIASATPLTSDTRLSRADRDALQNQIDAALAVLNKTAPRKATTKELQDAMNDLRALYEALARKAGQPILPPSNTGGVGGGGGRSSGGTIKKAATTNNSGALVVGVDGNWQLIDEKNHRWIFRSNDKNHVVGWNRIGYTYEGRNRVDWYYFNADGIMQDGWFYDTEGGHWYYLNENHDGFFGHLTYGWHHDSQDGKWYYLDPVSGAMHTGWNYIQGEWYYLNPTAPARTYFFSEAENKWLYNRDVTTRPLGSMYRSEETPDGYRVNDSGAWVR